MFTFSCLLLAVAMVALARLSTRILAFTGHLHRLLALRASNYPFLWMEARLLARLDQTVRLMLSLFVA